MSVPGPIRGLCATAALLLVAAPAAAQPASAARRTAAPPPCTPLTSERLRLDHVPIAVRDLDAAVRTFAALGFSFKPGYPHPNSILNQHVKFADGSALELITASEPRDELARDYLSFLERGEGGAFLSLDGGEVRPLSGALRGPEPRHRTGTGSYADFLGFPPGHDLRYLFFVRIRSRPPDRAEHLRHANTAARLSAVWLRRADPGRDARALGRVGGRVCPAALRLPAGPVAAEVRLGGGGRVYLVNAPGQPARRAVAGVTVEVADLAAARRAVALPDTALQRGRDLRGAYLRIPPGHAHGLWLELLQPLRR